MTKKSAKLCEKERNRDEGRKRRNDGATDPVAKEVPDLASRVQLGSSLGNTDYKMFFPINQNTNKIFSVIAFYGPGVKGHMSHAFT